MPLFMLKFKLPEIFAVAVFMAVTALACADSDNTTETVAELYPSLASGPLTYARLKDLPDGVLLKADGIEVKFAEIEKKIAAQPMQVQEMMKGNHFFVLEQETAPKLLALLARKQLSAQGEQLDELNDDQLIEKLFDKMLAELSVSEAEQKTFYKDNPQFFRATPFDGVKEQIANHLIRQKKQHFVDDYVRDIGRELPIEVAADWTKKQAEMATDNPLDKARESGKPTVCLFYAASPCCPDAMGPILEMLAKGFGDRLNTLTFNPGANPILAARYRVRGNPALIFFDSDGRETFRKQSAMSRDEVLSKLSEIGIE